MIVTHSLRSIVRDKIDVRCSKSIQDLLWFEISYVGEGDHGVINCSHRMGDGVGYIVVEAPEELFLEEELGRPEPEKGRGCRRMER